MQLKLNKDETKELLDYGCVTVVRNRQTIIVEKKPYIEGYNITVECKYDDVKLYKEKTNV